MMNSRRQGAAGALAAGVVTTLLVLGASRMEPGETGAHRVAADPVAFVHHGERGRLASLGQQDDQGTTTTTEATTTTAEPTTTETTEAPTTATTQDATTTTAGDPTTEVTEPVADSNGGDDIDWALVGIIAAIVVVVLAIIWLLIAAGRSRARDERVQTRHIRDIVSRAEWIHDDVSLEVMGAMASPDRLRVTWADARRRINDLASEATSLAARDTDQRRADDLRRLSHALGRLAGSLDTHVSLQLQEPTDPSTQAALAASADTVAQRRNELLTDLSPFRARV